MTTGTAVLTNIGQLVTNDPERDGLLGLVESGAVIIEEGLVAWVGEESDLPPAPGGAASIDCHGNAVVPGFVDAHTHLAFAGDRADEFGRRLRGESYEEIMAAGGGIQSTVAATRSASVSELTGTTMARLRRMSRTGTTTVEVKSGYGLDLHNEKRLLAVAGAAGAAVPIDVVPTFLGAHTVSPEFAGDADGYIDNVIEEMLPACSPLARFCDVFCDLGVFSVEQARRVLEAGRMHGLEPRLHANQLAHSGGARLAAEMGAVSADHLDHLHDEDITALHDAGTVAVLLPGVSLSLRLPQARGIDLWEAGVTVALATDCNPGTSNIESMPFVIGIACLEMGLSPEQAVWSATRGGALALGLRDRGALVPGMLGDVAILAHPSYVHLAYRPDAPAVAWVLKRGRPTVADLV
ncbi:MAG: imidazolonepropionase [bacterium]|nr:imidazolonepropionase [bacterium]MCP4966333.1 imidazolonepropionase [bacterium]